MINSVGLQYAKAIFDLACEKKCATDYYQALEVINKAEKNKALDRVLEVSVPESIYEELRNLLNK